MTSTPSSSPDPVVRPRISVVDRDMAYSGLVIQRNLSFTVQRAEIFVVMGGSGCGKSTLLRHLVGLKEPTRGDVLYDGRSLWTADPAEVSGGMAKRAALARALALDPEILFLDEPSTGLDPISARLLDDLILDLRDGLGTTVVVVTHDLASIQAIGDNSVFLDSETKTLIAQGHPKALLADPPNPRVRAFLTREPISR